jgi:hypothetical protein
MLRGMLGIQIEISPDTKITIVACLGILSLFLWLALHPMMAT